MTPQPWVSCWSAIVDVLVDVALRVLDVDLEAGGLQTLLEVLAVEVLPARRRRRVGQDHAGAGGCVAAAALAVTGVAVAAGTAGQQHRGRAREGGHGEE